MSRIRVSAVRGHVGAVGCESRNQRVGERDHIVGIRCEQIQVPGGLIDEAEREHGAPACEGSMSGLGQIQRQSGELLVQRVKTREAEASGKLETQWQPHLAGQRPIQAVKVIGDGHGS